LQVLLVQGAVVEVAHTHHQPLEHKVRVGQVVLVLLFLKLWGKNGT
jgi:hypothetical protein